MFYKTYTGHYAYRVYLSYGLYTIPNTQLMANTANRHARFTTEVHNTVNTDV